MSQRPSKLIISKISKTQLSYKFLDHETDAFIEVTAKDLKEAFLITANAVINLTLDQDKVKEKDQKKNYCTRKRPQISFVQLARRSNFCPNHRRFCDKKNRT